MNELEQTKNINIRVFVMDGTWTSEYMTSVKMTKPYLKKKVHIDIGITKNRHRLSKKIKPLNVDIKATGDIDE